MDDKFNLELENIKGECDFIFALAGNPNVGKSTFFNHLTGLGVTTANYPGKTVSLNFGKIVFNNHTICLVDLPGIYMLGSMSEDQALATETILNQKFDAIIYLLDATNFSRNLYLLFQLIDIGLPIIVSLNLTDEAERKGFEIDFKGLEKELNVPVIPTIATRGKGIQTILEEAINFSKSRHIKDRTLKYGKDIEDKIEELSNYIKETGFKNSYSLSNKALAVLILEKNPIILELLKEEKNIIKKADEIAGSITEIHAEDASLRIVRERHGLAGSIAEIFQIRKKKPEAMLDKIWRLSTAPVSGTAIFFLLLGAMFSTLFYVGKFLSHLIENLWTSFISPPVDGFLLNTFGHFWGKILIWGPDTGVLAALTVGLPYVFVFFLMLAILEDIGYINALAFLVDIVMHRFGLHGRSVILLLAGIGCNVPAIIGTRVLQTKKERIIASFLIVLMPCSARIAVIMGSVSLFLGPVWVILLFLIVFAIISVTALVLNKVIKGKEFGFVMEVFPFRFPHLKTVLKKTWNTFRDFLFVATPLVVAGSLVMGFLYESGYIFYLTKILAPVVEGMLGLPAIAGLALLMAILRKELGLQILYAMAIMIYGKIAQNNLLGFMDQRQIFIFALLNTLYIPCIATISALAKELSWKQAAIISFSIIITATLVGTAVNWILKFLL